MILVLLIFVIIFEIISIIKEKIIKNRIFNDMESKSTEIIRAIVVIIPKN